MDNTELKSIFHQAGIRYFNDNIKQMLKNAISDLYNLNPYFVKFICIEHLDRAIFKYREACKNQKIYNTRNYFTACLKSSIEELEIDSE